MFTEKLVKKIFLFSGILVLVIAFGMFVTLISDTVPVFKTFGLKFLYSSAWNPTEGHEEYGALSFVTGTLLSSLLALVFCIPFAFSVSIFLAEYSPSKKISNLLRTVIEMLAGVPSIVYGLWGFYVVRPFIGNIFGTQGYGILTAAIILAIMIIPYATSLSYEVLKMVPNYLKEAGYSLGATKREVIMSIVFPSASSGIVASYILSLGRALGETMAVTMVIGNANVIAHGLLGSTNTMASVIANQFGEADGLKLSALISIGLLLFIITGVVNYSGKLIIRKLSK